MLRREAAKKFNRVLEVGRMLRLGRQESLQGHVERAGNLAQNKHRRVSRARLQLREKALRYTRICCQGLAREPTLCPRRSDVLTQQLQIFGIAARVPRLALQN